MTNIWPIKKFGDSAKRKVEDKLRHHSNPSQKKVLIKKIVNSDTERKRSKLRKYTWKFSWFLLDTRQIGHWTCLSDGLSVLLFRLL